MNKERYIEPESTSWTYENIIEAIDHCHMGEGCPGCPGPQAACGSCDIVTLRRDIKTQQILGGLVESVERMSPEQLIVFKDLALYNLVDPLYADLCKVKEMDER